MPFECFPFTQFFTSLRLIVHIFLAESSSWRWNGAHQKRPLSSVVLEPGVKDMLISDTKDFLASEAWYADRGVFSFVPSEHFCNHLSQVSPIAEAIFFMG